MLAFVHPISAFLIRPPLHFLLNCRHQKPPSDFSPLSCHFRKCVTPCYFYRIRHPVPHPYNPPTITVVHKIYCFYILVQSNWRVCCWSHLELLLTISRGLELLPRPARGWGVGVGGGDPMRNCLITLLLRRGFTRCKLVCELKLSLRGVLFVLGSWRLGMRVVARKLLYERGEIYRSFGCFSLSNERNTKTEPICWPYRRNFGGRGSVIGTINWTRTVCAASDRKEMPRAVDFQFSFVFFGFVNLL